MSIMETLKYADYEVWEDKDSRIDDCASFSFCTTIFCPHCKHGLKPMVSGEQRICPQCKLKMERIGDNLVCELQESKDKKEKTK